MRRASFEPIFGSMFALCMKLCESRAATARLLLLLLLLNQL
jgi:hypothetical protein